MKNSSKCVKIIKRDFKNHVKVILILFQYHSKNMIATQQFEKGHKNKEIVAHGKIIEWERKHV